MINAEELIKYFSDAVDNSTEKKEDEKELSLGQKIRLGLNKKLVTNNEKEAYRKLLEGDEKEFKRLTKKAHRKTSAIATTALPLLAGTAVMAEDSLKTNYTPTLKDLGKIAGASAISGLYGASLGHLGGAITARNTIKKLNKLSPEERTRALKQLSDELDYFDGKISKEEFGKKYGKKLKNK